MSEIIPFANPATLAQPYAEKLLMNGDLDSIEHSDAELENLRDLMQLAYDTNTLNARFYVQSRKSIITPATQESLHNVAVIHFNEGLDYSGKFIGYSTVRIGQLIGGNAIRALCLTFENTTLLPYFDQVSPDKWLHTPVHAVGDMEKLVA